MKSHYQTTLHNNAGTLCTGEPASRLVAVCHSKWTGDTPADHPQTVANAERLAACWNALHGLDLPPGIAPGAVAALVTAARELAEECDLLVGAPAERVKAALAPFGADPAPVYPPADDISRDILNPL